MKFLALALAASLLSGCMQPRPSPESGIAPNGGAMGFVETAPARHSISSSSTTSGFGVALNDLRARYGMGALREDRRLSAAAQAFAEDMARHGYHSHYGRDGSDIVTRVQGAGCRGGGHFAENIAWGQDTAQDSLSGWFASPHHRDNMLSRKYGVYGLGQAGGVWVLDFAGGC
ncbi:CAP domain-containing protein [Rubellimicrobium rubrum]|nr:CAP domain-containing protein [Rubellimicrobium rubrum]